jgi:hypothetical protein
MIATLLSLLMIGSWTESFETQTYFPPNNWIIVNQDALDAVWYRNIIEGHTGTHCATIYGDTLFSGLNSTNQDYLITPRIIPLGSDTFMSFWYRSSSSDGCSLDILISTTTTPSMPSFSLLQTLYVTNTIWTQQIVSLSSYNGTPLYIAFKIRKVPTQQRFYLDDITLPDITSPQFMINGRLRTKGPPSQKYLQVWGNHYEMGYAHGFLLAEEIMAQFNRYLIGSSLWQWFSPYQWENTILPYWRIHFSIPLKYQQEAQGIYDGMVSKGISLIHPGLARSITAEDLLCYNTLPDLGHLLTKSREWCSSLSGWGQSTINDDSLQGGLIICRNLDHYSGTYMSYPNTSLIIAYAPELTNEQKHVMITTAGWFSCGSGVNREGIGICYNTGNYPDTTYIAPNSLIPIMFSLRDAIETIDPDNSGVNDIFDITYSIDHSTSSYSNAIHLFSPYNISHLTPAGIFEINNISDTLRLVANNSITPAINSQYNLGVTNHLRVLYPPIYCQRYQRIVDSLNTNFNLSTQRAIVIGSSVAAEYYVPWYGWCTAQQMVIRPNMIQENPDWSCIGVSYASRNVSAHHFPKIWYSWNELFEGLLGIEENEITTLSVLTTKGFKIYPNPASSFFTVRCPSNVKNIKIYDVTGKIIKNEKLKGSKNKRISLDGIKNGVYFVKVDNNPQVTKIIVTK